jgi:hypothetical protein
MPKLIFPDPETKTKPSPQISCMHVTRGFNYRFKILGYRSYMNIEKKKGNVNNVDLLVTRELSPTTFQNTTIGEKVRPQRSF